MYVLKHQKETYHSDCLQPTVRYGESSVMIWCAISWKSAKPMLSLYGIINSRDYLKILSDQALFSDGKPFYKMIMLIHIARILKEWHEEHCKEIEHLVWPVQSLDFNIIKHLWSALETQIRHRFYPYIKFIYLVIYSLYSSMNLYIYNPFIDLFKHK